MKLHILFCVVIAVMTGANMADSDDGLINPSEQLDNLVSQLHRIEIEKGGTNSVLPKIVNYLARLLGKAKDEHSLFVASDDGQVHHGGILGDLVGAVIGTIGHLLGGKAGMCGSADGIFMKEHGGLVGGLLDLLKPVIGPLASDKGDDVESEDQKYPITKFDLDKLPQGDQLTTLVEKLQQLKKISGGKGGPVTKILHYLTGELLNVHKKHSLFIVSDDGKIHHGGITGDIVGALLGTLGLILGGEHGMCGGPHGAYLHQHQGILGSLIHLLGPLLGPLARDA